jgi:hypothetical protein
LLQETVLLRIRLHCDGCADRIRRRIYKIKGEDFIFLINLSSVSFCTTLVLLFVLLLWLQN